VHYSAGSSVLILLVVPASSVVNAGRIRVVPDIASAAELLLMAGSAALILREKKLDEMSSLSVSAKDVLSG